MTLELFDNNNKCPFEIGELSTIRCADMMVYDGGEVLHVVRNSGLEEYYLSVPMNGHLDGGYPVYDSSTGFSMLNCEQWLNDKSAWDRMI